MNKYVIAIFMFGPTFNSEACTLDECQVSYFSEQLNSFNSELFERSHHWSNGYPFLNRWEEGAINFSNHGMSIELSNKQQDSEKYNYRSGELRSHHFYGYGCFSIEIKPISSPGIITSFFLFAGKFDKYEGSNAQHNEIDIEFLGKDTRSIQFNYWTNDDQYQSNNSVLIPLGFDASEKFHKYSMLWSKEKIQWFVDGEKYYEVVQSKKISTPITTDTRLKIMANVWPVDKSLSSWAGKIEKMTQPLNSTYRNLSFQSEGTCENH